MAYIGNEPSVNFTSFAKQDITGDGGANYTLTYAVANANEIEVFVNNVRQEPSIAYTVTGTALSMTGNVASTDDFYVIYLGKALQTTVPPDGSVTNAKIANSTIDLTSKVTGVLPVANGGTGNTVGSTTTYVNNLGVAGTNVTSFDTNFTGNALNGGIKAFKVFMTELNNGSNNYMHFRTLDSSGATDGGYNATFQFATGSTYNQNGNTDTNQANAMALGYYAGSYTIVIDCQLIDPSTNMWVFKATSNSVNASTPTSGSSIAYNTLGASKPITGFRISSSATNGLGIGSLKYGYSYTT